MLLTHTGTSSYANTVQHISAFSKPPAALVVFTASSSHISSMLELKVQLEQKTTSLFQADKCDEEFICLFVPNLPVIDCAAIKNTVNTEHRSVGLICLIKEIKSLLEIRKFASP